jgi:structure-specific recognition protein 1
MIEAMPMPNRLLTAYMFFNKEKRPQINEENEDMSFGEVSTVIGKLWQSLSTEGKQPYENLAMEDKARYEIEIQVCYHSTQLY